MTARPHTPYEGTSDLDTAQEGTIEARITAAMVSYLGGALGWRKKDISDRIRRELTREIPRGVLSSLDEAGLEVQGKTVLDLGSGLGALSSELALRGARVLAVEPDVAWRAITAARLPRGGSGVVVASVGEALPFRSGSIDLVVSLQVLEHVRDPQQVLCEVYRVLRPGGSFFLACENYLAFREQHYRVAWFPLLPKPIGSVYLRLRGRSPAFLRDAVTYITLPGVLRMLSRAGFLRVRETEIVGKVRSPGELRAGWKRVVVGMLTRVVSTSVLSWNWMLLDTARRLFRIGIVELLTRPLDHHPQANADR
jgi:SAM-dependent methyltransferase